MAKEDQYSIIRRKVIFANNPFHTCMFVALQVNGIQFSDAGRFIGYVIAFIFFSPFLTK